MLFFHGDCTSLHSAGDVLKSALHSCDPPTTAVMHPTILQIHLCVYVCDFASVCESVKGNTPRSALPSFFLARSNFK